MLRIIFLHSELSGYFLRCCRELKQSGCELSIAALPAASNAPYELASDGLTIDLNPPDLKQLVADFRPDCMVIAGWWNSSYLTEAQRAVTLGIPVIMTCDEKWVGTLKQRLKLTWIRGRVRNAATHFWVPGLPHYPIAKYLGFPPSKILTGVYSCDFDAFSKSPAHLKSETPHFLFVGRMESVKGLNVLIDAYQKYRRLVQNPWDLKLVGAGSLAGFINSTPNVQYTPFVQPDQLPQVLSAASAFVMPSVNEPWCVAIHEAAAAGLPIICSNVCGASAHLVFHNQNGMIFQANKSDELTDCLLRVHHLRSDILLQWGELSRHLAGQFTPHRWVQCVREIAGG